MRHAHLLTLLMLCGFSASAAAQAHQANFDTLAEGAIGQSVVEDGLVFSNLDRYLGGSNETFVAEDASSTLAGAIGFSSPNCLGFGGYSPGTSAAYSRCGRFDITPPAGSYSHAELALFITGGSSGGNLVTLEAYLGAGLVASDVYVVPTVFGFYETQLVIDGVDFDSLKLVGSGAGNQGAFFALVDSVSVGSAVAPGTIYCVGDGSGSACPCGNPGASEAGCTNSTGNGAELTAGGSAGLAANDLDFKLMSMPSTQPALLFAGLNAVNGGLGTLFGDGLRCAGGSIQRISVQQSTANGDVMWSPGLLSGHGWSAGMTIHFQGWYRDPAGVCGSGFNLSNGVAITLQS